MNPSISISIAAYNDGATIGRLIDESISILSTLSSDFEVFVINDGSSDQTSQILHQKTKQHSSLRIYEHPQNMGFGTTIREAYTLPSKDWIFFLPGDEQIPPGELLKLFPYCSAYDFILGRRRHRKDPWNRRFNSWCYNKFISLLAKQKIEDVNSVGLLKKESLSGVLFHSRSAFIHAEILLNVLKQGKKITHVDIEHQPRHHGQGSGAKPAIILKTILDMVKYFFS